MKFWQKREGSDYFSGKRVLIFHFRIGKTDGVSLEIAAWKNLMEKSGAKVYLCGGDQSIGANFVINHFEYQLDEQIFKIGENAFNGWKNYSGEDDFKSEFLKIQHQLEDKFCQVLKLVNPDLIIVSNVFSVGENLPAAGALAKTLLSVRIPTLLVHHDFYWDNNRFTNPSCQFVKDYLEWFFPPRANHLRHACINSLAQNELYRRRGIKAFLLPDTVDFNRHFKDHNASCSRLLARYGVNDSDLVILQATRIVRRKNIELSIDFVKELSNKQRLTTLMKEGLYNGKGFDPLRGRVVLVLGGYAERRDQEYLSLLLKYAKKQAVHCIYLNGDINTGTSVEENLFNLYNYACLITYPSEKEGFGNQFLEAVLSRTPIVIYEYPVFKSDIRPKGFSVISLGDKLAYDPETKLAKLERSIIRHAADQAIELLTNPHLYREVVENNFQIGKANYSYEKALEYFSRALNGGWGDNLRKLQLSYSKFFKPKTPLPIDRSKSDQVYASNLTK